MAMLLSPEPPPSRFFLGAEQSLIDRSMREGRADGGDGDLIACWRVLRPESKDGARGAKSRRSWSFASVSSRWLDRIDGDRLVVQRQQCSCLCV